MATLNISPSADTYLNEQAATTNYGSSDVIFVGKADVGQQKNAILRFSLSSLPADATVTAASLNLRCTTAGTGQFTILHLVDAPEWVEGQATWNEYATGSSWGGEVTVGGDTDPDSPESTVNSPSGTGDVSYDVGFLVDFAIEQEYTKVEVFLYSANTINDNQFASQDHATAAWRPVLSLTYTAPESESPITASLSVNSVDDASGWRNVTRAERAKFKGNETVVSLTPSSTPEYIDWRFYRSFDAEPHITVRTNSNGIVGNNIAVVTLSTLTSLHINLNRVHTWQLSYSINGQAYTSRTTIATTPRRITGKHRDTSSVNDTSRGATVTTSNPLWTEERTSRGVRIVNNLYPNQ